MSGFAGLQLQFMPAERLAAQSDDVLREVLGAACFSDAPPQMRTAVDLPLACVRVEPFAGEAAVPGAAMCEIWSTDMPLRAGRHGRLHYRCDEEVLFGVVQTHEAVHADQAEAVPLMQRAAEQAYTDLFTALDALGYPHLLRVWNHVPDINAQHAGLELYRQFNIGRQDAFLACGRQVAGASVPAASALGARQGSALVLYAMASRRAPVALENPRQVSAYRYPSQYGPRAPTFSRANLVSVGGRRVLFISGTASIVGHQSMHVGDVVMQTRETLRNIEALLLQAATHGATGLSLAHLHYKVYVRHARDLPSVRAEMVRAVGARAPALYLQADVCRADLLVEIEAVAFTEEQETSC